MSENLYRLKYSELVGTVVPRAREIAADWLNEHPNLSVDIWAPHPDNAKGTYRDLSTGRIIHVSERHIHVLGYHPAAADAGKRKEVYPDRSDFVFPGETPGKPKTIAELIFNPLTDTEQSALGQLAAAILEDPQIAPHLWRASQADRPLALPLGSPRDTAIALLYRLFPAKK